MKSCVPDSIKEKSWYPRVLQVARILQFIAAIVNIGLFAAYVARTATRASNSSGAVLGILVAGIVFSTIATAINCTKMGTKTRVTTILWIFDLLFIAAFVAVTVITALDSGRPGGSGGRCAGSNDDEDDGDDGDDDEDNDTGMSRCHLTFGSLALSVIST